jgi:hypothetical protein
MRSGAERSVYSREMMAERHSMARQTVRIESQVGSAA